MFCTKKFFIFLHIAYFFPVLGMEKTCTKITIFHLPEDVFTYILDLCLKPQKTFTKNISHLVLDYMFYKRITSSKKTQWAQGQAFFLDEYLKIEYVRNVYLLYAALRLVSSRMALKINNYFSCLFNKKFTQSFLCTKTNIYVIYLSNLFSYLKYSIYYNNFKHDNRYRILYLLSLNSFNKSSSLHVTINMDTKKLCIFANIGRYYRWSIKQQLGFNFQKIINPTKKVNFCFDTPNHLFDKDQCLHCSFYEKFLKPKDAKRIQYYIDSLIIKASYHYYQSPPPCFVTQYKNIASLEDINLHFMISYKLNEDVCLKKDLFF